MSKSASNSSVTSSRSNVGSDIAASVAMTSDPQDARSAPSLLDVVRGDG